jgi:hypothetical protein
MATQEHPDSERTTAELARLERLERQLSAERGRVHERMDFDLPNEMTARGERHASADRLSLHRRIERQLSDERRALHQRIDLLRAELDGEPAKDEIAG